MELAAGIRARISGLNGRADLNGKEAEVLHFAEEAGRWAVHVLGTGEGVRVKPANLTPIPTPAEPQEDEQWWESAARCLAESHGDFAAARTSYFRSIEQRLKTLDPMLHEDMKAGRCSGPGQEARVALTFDAAAAFLKSVKGGLSENPGLANDQRAIAKAVCHWATDGSVPDLRPNTKVLDVGCGDGAYVPMLLECGASKVRADRGRMRGDDANRPHP